MGSGEPLQRVRGRLHVTVLGGPLLPAAIAAIAGRIAASGANIDRIGRLANRPVTCIEFEVSGADPVGLRTVLARESVELGVDVAVQRAGLHRRAMRLVVMDVDSTLLQDEAIDLLAARAGCAAAGARDDGRGHARRAGLRRVAAPARRAAGRPGRVGHRRGRRLAAAGARGPDADPHAEATRLPLRRRQRRIHPGYRLADASSSGWTSPRPTRWRSRTASSPAGSSAR